MYVEALWIANWKKVLVYTSFNLFQFVLLCLTILFNLQSQTLIWVNAVYSMLFLLLEFRQMINHKLDYLTEPYNYFDIGGNVLIVITAINRRNHGPQFFELESHKNILIVGLLLIGLRSYTQLRIFTPYRTLIELIKQTLIDITPFSTILIMITALTAIVKGLQFVGKDTSNIS